MTETTEDLTETLRQRRLQCIAALRGLDERAGIERCAFCHESFLTDSAIAPSRCVCNSCWPDVSAIEMAANTEVKPAREAGSA